MKIPILALILFLTYMTVFGESTENIVFGIYCGECDENCSYFVKQADEEYFEDTSAAYFSNRASFIKQIHFKEISGEVFSNPIDIDEVASVLSKYESIIGEPDASDQCGYFIEIQQQGKSQRYLIDPNYDSIEIQKLLDQVFSYEFEKRKLETDYKNWPEMFEYQLIMLDSLWRQKRD